MHKKSFYRKLQFSFLMISLGYILLITIFFSFQTRSFFEEASNSVTAEITRSTSDRILQMLNTAVTFCAILPNDIQLTPTAEKENIYINACTNQQILSNYQVILQDTNSLYTTYHPAQDLFVTGNQSGSLSYLADLICMPEIELRDTIESVADMSWYYQSDSEGSITDLLFVKKVQNPEIVETYVLIYFDINSILAEFDIDSGELFLLPNVEATQEIIFTNVMDGNNYQIITPDNQSQGFVLLFQYNKPTWQEYVNFILTPNNIMLYLILILSGFFSLFLAQYNYAPLKKVLDNMGLIAEQDEFLDEFNQIENYLQSIQANSKVSPTEPTTENPIICLDFVQPSLQEGVREKLLEYVAQHYQEDISLDDIGAYFGLSSSYMSFLFKSETSRNFKDYLNYYRVQKFKQIAIERKSQNIKTLYLEIGFNNRQTFTRIFKKYEGVTPGAFLEQWAKT